MYSLLLHPAELDKLTLEESNMQSLFECKEERFLVAIDYSFRLQCAQDKVCNTSKKEVVLLLFQVIPLSPHHDIRASPRLFIHLFSFFISLQ